MAQRLKVSYLGTNVGKIYLSDVDKRNQLGGSKEGNYHGGQDQYIIWGETKVLELTSEVLYSMSRGILKYFSDPNSSTAFKTGAPLTLEIGDFDYTDEVPVQFPTSGPDRFDDDYMQKLANDKYAPTGIAGVTGYYYGNML